jgi:TP901 family phage tail tape measure protein
MEVFKAFTTLALVDLVSGPLGGARSAIAATDAATNGLGVRMGKLATAMAPVAIAAGVVLSSFGACAAKAMEFENSMADVAKVVEFKTAAEFRGMGDTIKEMSGRLPMAQEGIAAIIAAAAQSGVAKNDLVDFAEQAAKMGIAFDLTADQAGKMMADWRAGMSLTLPQTYSLADAVNHLSNNMNATAPALGEVIQRAGALAMSCGLAETEVAALGAAFLSAGASPEIASTALSKFVGTLSRAEGMSGRAEKALESLGFSSVQLAKDMQTDAKGTIFSVMQKLSGMSKDKQVGMLTQIFGEESIKAIAPLLANMGNLEQAFDLVADKAKFAGSMQAEFEARSKTTSNALLLMRNKFGNLSISIGTIFLPAISWAAEKLGILADALRWVVDSPFGQWLLPVIGAISAAVVGITAFSGAMWGASKALPLVAKALAPVKAAILGLGWPVLAVIAVVAALYAAYKTNFGGIADVIDRWYNNIRIVVQGVIAVFKSLTGSSFEIRGELAKEIKAAGLENFVLTVSKIIYRIKELFRGVSEAFDLTPAIVVLTPAIVKIREIFDSLGRIFTDVFGGEVTSSVLTFENAGNALGTAATKIFEGIATAVTIAVNAIDMLINGVKMVCSFFTGDFAAAGEAGKAILAGLGNSIASLADLFGVGDRLRAAWGEAVTFLDSIDLSECGTRILETLKQGILSAAESVKDSVTGVFQSIRDLLPFSDAKEGPFSQLTLSGTRLMTTLAEGVQGGAGALKASFTGTLDSIGSSISNWWTGLWSDGDKKIAPDLKPPPVPAEDPEKARERGEAGALAGNTYTFHITANLPNVQDGKGFMQSLNNLVADYGGGFAPA